MPQYGIHGNAWSLKKNRVIFHFAKRSKKLDDFPGYFDNLFAGGQPVGISIIDNLKKDGSYYQKCNMHYEIPMNHNIYKNFFKVNK